MNALKQIKSDDEIKNLWQIKAVGKSSVLELRAIKKNSPIVIRIFKCKDYKSVEDLKLAFEQEALRLNADGYNIYIVMNPVKDDFNSKSATDADIAYRDLLLIDIDKCGHVGEASTNEELEAAKALADAIAAYLKQGGWDEPLRVMSGNGYHLYYILKDVENSDTTKDAIKDFLKNLASKFDNELVKVDTCVFNASRITKVVGTIAYKGTESKERPHRMAVML